jgi:hypothetical protein
MLKEGAATQGVWLPLALAQIYQILIALVKMWAAKESGIKVPTTAEALKAFCLPAMAEAVEEDEKEREALALFNSIKNLAAKQEAKGKGK